MLNLNLKLEMRLILFLFLISDSWWNMFGFDTLNLQNVSICILSHPCNSFGCERNWSMFEHIHSKKRNRLTVERMNDLVYVHYNLRLRYRKAFDHDNTPICLEEVDPQSEWISETTDAVFSDEDLDWVDQAEREAEVVAMAEEEARARGDIAAVSESGMGSQIQAKTMAATATSSRTFRRLRRKDAGSTMP